MEGGSSITTVGHRSAFVRMVRTKQAVGEDNVAGSLEVESTKSNLSPTSENELRKEARHGKKTNHSGLRVTLNCCLQAAISAARLYCAGGKMPELPDGRYT